MFGGIANWLRALESKDAVEVCAAAKSLGVAREQRAVEPLLKILERSVEPISADELRINTAVVEALYQISDPDSVKVLGPYISLRSSWLKGEGTRIPGLVAKTLGEIGSKRAIRFLVDKVASSDWHYGGQETIAALKKCDRELVIDLLVEKLTQSKEPRSRQQLLQVLRELRWKPTDPRQRAEIAIELGKFQEALAEGAAAFEPLIQILLKLPRAFDFSSKVEVARWKDGITALAELGDKRATPHFIGLLSNPSFEVKAECAHGLVKLSAKLVEDGDRSVLVDVREALRTHAYAEIAVPIIEFLETIRDGESFDVLIERVSGRVDKTVRRAAVALSHFGDPRAIVPILRVRSVIDNAGQMWSLLEQFAQLRYLDYWLAALQEPQPDVRRGAANVLALIKDPRSVEQLSAALGQAINEFYSAEALEKLIVYNGGPKEVLALNYSTHYAKFPNEFQTSRTGMENHVGVCVSLATALGELGEVRAAAALMLLLQDNSERIPWPIESNGRLLLEAAEPKIKWAAAQALVKLRHPEAAEWLIRELQRERGTPSNVFNKQQVAFELAKLGDARGNEALVAELTGPNRKQAAQFLALAGDQRGTAWLAQHVNSLVAHIAKCPEDAYESARELAEFGDQRCVPALLGMLNGLSRNAPGRFRDAVDMLARAGDLRVVAPLVDWLGRKLSYDCHKQVVVTLQKLLAEIGASMDLRLLRRLASIPVTATVISQKAVYDDDAFANFPGSFAEKEREEPTYIDVEVPFDQTSLRALADAELARLIVPPPPLPFAEPVALPLADTQALANEDESKTAGRVATPSATAKPDRSAAAHDRSGPDMFDVQLAKDPERAYGAAITLARRGDRRGIPVLMAILKMSARSEPGRFTDSMDALVNFGEIGVIAPLLQRLERRLERQLHERIVDALVKMIETVGTSIATGDLQRLAAIPQHVEVRDQKAVYRSGPAGDFYNSMAEKENDGEWSFEAVLVTVNQSRLRDLAYAELAKRTTPQAPLPFAEPIAALPVAIPIAQAAAPPNPGEEDIIVATAATGHVHPLPEAMLEEAIVVEDEVAAAVPAPPPMPEPPYTVCIQAGKFLVICRCGSRYPVPFEFAGKRTKCKKCGQAMVMPQTPTH